jgi:predicted dehydrogenase
MKQVSVLIIGAGSRGGGYADLIAGMPERARVAGVAEPREEFRSKFLAEHAVEPQQVFTDWRQAAERPRFADAVVIATQDAMHVEPAVAFAEKGYHVLLEKPMAPNEADCRRIVAAVNGKVIFAVGHVMRYTLYSRAMKRLLDSGALGDIVSMQHLEPVGFWHQAHSFVRGSWGNEAESSPMLLAKSCHDLDWIRYMMGKRCMQVSSFGNLKHFRKENQPAGAADRCLDCGMEATCPYSAARFYLGRVEQGKLGWPVDVLAANPTKESVTEALRTGQYGRCVYACDNDVVDHQVVNMSFEDGSSAAFTMTAFNRGYGRITRIFGTHGEVYGDGEKIEHYDFLTGATKLVDINAGDHTLAGGHGGGDGGLMDSFIAAIAENDQGKVLSGPEESLETHLMVFAAERARKEGRVVEVEISAVAI